MSSKAKSTVLYNVILIIGMFIGALVQTVYLNNTHHTNPRVNEFAIYDTLDSWSILQMAIIKTESDFNPLAVGKSNDAGIVQITPVYVNDVNRILGKDEYMHEDAFSPSRSLEMFNIYQSNYNPDRDILRAIHLHNPKGDSINYTKRVLKNIEYIEQYECIRALVLERK